ncbi:hypothetical protein Ccrd_009061 [Cynara cardunculus var. scolymus]|uniref:Aminotransferase class I/classII large domain-containing protein n=1 Tax=Cynara cardunculus var. scolymus TaxID=59895 RepID=A0A124SIF4_CYNCS|nr:hypothetical protein Ccrd_009061 [Cynara cardunculus var. scolymus]
MEKKLSSVAKALKPSPIQQLSYLAERTNALNLAEGFPDFPAPPHVKAAAVSAITSDFNQYRHVQGICDLLADKMKQMHGLDILPFAVARLRHLLLQLLNPGDEVILFDPSFETYETCILMAGGVPVYVALEPPCWTLDQVKLLGVFTAKTKALLLHSPHNPTGKVFNMDELEIIAEYCRTKDCIAITDEVYEHVTYDSESHISLASLPGMQKRTIITSSLSKTYSVTAIRSIHTKVTDSAPAPFQEAALTALTSPQEYYKSLRKDYESKRDFVFKLLSEVGFEVQFMPKGSFFIFAAIPETCKLNDVEFVEELIKQAGVVAVPGCGFFHRSHYSRENVGSYQYHNRYIRFAFCKGATTLTSAAHEIQQLIDASGRLKLF